VLHKVRPDAAEQKRIADTMSEPLRVCGVELVETNTDGGYPVYTMLSKVTGNTGRPKNVIFAPLGKPDIRFSDAVNNDIEIVSDSEKILTYDRPIPIDGLRWRDLQAWWADRQKVSNDLDAKKSLYRRLAASLPDSPPQKLLFETFFASFKKSFDDLPALLPEVFLHYDPKTVKERGRDALFRQRMDFLMLFSHQTRVVIEVDGIQHYANKSTGLADVRLYAQMVAADRELRLRGYEVYRFGGVELEGDHGEEIAADFFQRLFARHEIAVPG
jgi:very-short-patch-repair endonuclease